MNRRPALRGRLLAAAVLGLAMPVVLPGGTGVPTAQPICASASVTAIVVGTHTVGPYCEPYADATVCNHKEAGLTGTFGVVTDVCVPRP
jgi:hypothetical protein